MTIVLISLSNTIQDNSLLKANSDTNGEAQAPADFSLEKYLRYRFDARVVGHEDVPYLEQNPRP